MIRFLALTAIAIALMLMPAVAHAEITEGSYDAQGVCVTGPDPVFGDAVAVTANADAVTNDRPHIHVQDYINRGLITDRSELYGKCFIVQGVWLRADGQMHLHAFIPKDEQGHIAWVSQSEAMNFSSAAAEDNYFHRGDQEMASATNCADVGSTKAGRGNSGGDCNK